MKNKCCFHCWRCVHHCKLYKNGTLWQEIKNIPWAIYANTMNNIIEPLSVWKAQRHKRIYRCTVCGRLFAPKFYDEGWGPGLSLINCGWGKIHRPFLSHKYDRYICHICFDHEFRRINEDPMCGYTWDEWQDEVDKHNKKLLSAIKEKDPEYFNSYIKENYDWLIEKYELEDSK